jgi:hypothetical protein
MAVITDEDAVRSAVLDYVAGWFEGDAGRMNLLHLIDMPDGWKIVNAAWRLR